MLALNPELNTVAVARSRWDGWMQYSEKTDAGHLSVLRMGADYVDPSRGLAGLALEYDRWAGQGTEAGSYQRAGWRISPYVTRNTARGLVLDGQLSFGNSGRLAGADSAAASAASAARRLAVFARLSGTVPASGWSVSPYAQLFYSSSSLDCGCSGGDLETGELRFGPSFSRRYSLPDGLRLEPQLNLNSVYDPDKDAGHPAEGDWRTASEAVLGFVHRGGFRLTLAAGRSRTSADRAAEHSYHFKMQFPLR